MATAVLGCWWMQEDTGREPEPTAGAYALLVRSGRAGKLSYLALGDSYTIGEGVSPVDRWPMMTAAAVRASGVDLGDPDILAATGWTTGDLLAALRATPLAGRYDYVTLMIGVNNQYQHRPIDEYREQLKTLLDGSTRFTGGLAGRVIVLSIPDWGVTDFAADADRAAIAADIDRFNDVARELTAKAGAVWVDVTPISRQAAKDRAAFAPDGLHPSAKQYAMWAKLVAPAIK